MVTTRNAGRYVPGRYSAKVVSAEKPTQLRPLNVPDARKTISYKQLAKTLRFSVAKKLKPRTKENPLKKGDVPLSRKQSSILRQLFNLDNKYRPFGQHLDGLGVVTSWRSNINNAYHISLASFSAKIKPSSKLKFRDAEFQEQTAISDERLMFRFRTTTSID